MRNERRARRLVRLPSQQKAKGIQFPKHAIWVKFDSVGALMGALTVSYC
jgi:hypothetical protein